MNYVLIFILEKSSKKCTRSSNDEPSPKKSRKVSSSAPALSTLDTFSFLSRKPLKKNKNRSSADSLDGFNEDDEDKF